MDRNIDLAEHLFTRLAQIGIGSIHGVPGDYNLASLDYIERAGLRWVGNANELNAGYAADGYARIKGAGALITCFGVGELSAINAVAGAYAERVALVHIVGVPSRSSGFQSCLHHSLGDGNTRVFADMYKSITVAQARLEVGNSAGVLIDETLRQCLLQSRPVYIELPSDIVASKVSAPRTSLSLELSYPGPLKEPDSSIVEMMLDFILQGVRPLILVDGFAARYGIQQEVNELAQVTGFPILTTPFGKGIINETLPNFKGMFRGSTGDEASCKWVEMSELVLYFGPLESDVNTFGLCALAPSMATMIFEKNSISFPQSLEGLPQYKQTASTKTLLQELIKKLRCAELPTGDDQEPFPEVKDLPSHLLRNLPRSIPSSPVDQYSFFLRISNFFRPGDMILTEAGTASHGGQSFILPESMFLINSSLWLSIGYALAAAQGAALAQREMMRAGTRPHGRTILFVGDGSLQMSAQALSDMIRNRLDVTIFILNNNGYTIERLIHGFNASYNDIQPWRNLEAPSFFGAPRDDLSYPVRTRRIENWGDLEAVMEDFGIQKGKGMNMIEIIMDMADAPQSLKKIADYAREKNRGRW
ncbi:hypothetical protein ACHAQH_004741 [Verticillium albo-atrum]